MPTIDRQDSVLNILQNLRDLDGLKRLFWEELNYERENRPLSPRQWPESAREPLAEDPILFASGGEDNAFHVVYCRLESDILLRGLERPIVNRLTREHPYALFVFSNKAHTHWHFLNVKYDEDVEKRRLLRRITVRPGEGLRTATERMQMLDLERIGGTRSVASVSPLEIQSAHDDAFDVDKVTKAFYREIANWYFWALKNVTFPKDAPKERDGHDHISVIRLITRLIFCWFIREKGLIPDMLFDEPKLAGMLEGFAPGKTRNKDSVFYRAILQNLFFATLNTEMDQRGWRRADQNFMAHSLYRHRECFRDPKAGLDWFKDIPFLNGGLFECLDRDFGEAAKPRYLRVDGFSDRDDSRPTVPDFLFFGSDQDVDLSDDYGDNKFRRVRVRGLIDTLSRYKFTIQENTPLDQEVALDPELCGKVFENLLAAYNPETGTTARKATGSFYTPREIVDYMADESLVAYLKGKLEGGTGIPACASPSSPQTGMSVSPSVTITRRNLPHWTKEGAIYWVTFRLADSLPQDKLRAWSEERDIWKKAHPEPWSDADWEEYDERFGKRLDEWLDAGYGSRALMRPDVRDAVRECLMKFDGQRVRVHAAVIMPTHVHVVLEPLGANVLPQLLKGIKGASARQANDLLGTGGTFWMDESYDHIVRSEKQYRHFLRYVAENPRKANLGDSEYWLLKGDTDILVRDSAQAGMPVPPSSRESHIRALLAYDAEMPEFSEKETETLINAIDSLKALDPAVGSGAFPMGILHKLVLVLRKLDPDNKRWKAKQIAKLDDATMREDAERLFRENYDDYGRKLYLIENCIYGVDIQPIAVQIAKMRFFISLVVDQKVNPKAQNLGVRALPNLETKFVAANTLIGIEKKERQGDFLTEDTAAHQRLKVLREELTEVRHLHFSARTTKTKARCREKDSALREEMSELLKRAGMSASWSRQLAVWDPYDQNAHAEFFDPEWMFGVTAGFNVVLGNPPYGISFDGQMHETLKSAFTTYALRGESYVLFIEQGIRMLSDTGNLAFIVPDTYLNLGFTQPLRDFLLAETRVAHIYAMPAKVFAAATVDTTLLFVARAPATRKQLDYPIRVRRLAKTASEIDLGCPIAGFEISADVWSRQKIFNVYSSPIESALLDRVDAQNSLLSTFADVLSGIKAYEVGKGQPPQTARVRETKPFTSESREDKTWSPFLEGKHIVRYANLWNHDNWIRYGPWLAAPRDEDRFKGEKLLVRKIVDRRLIGTVVSGDTYCNTLLFIIKTRRQGIQPKYLLAILCSAFIGWYFRKRFQISSTDTFPQILARDILQFPVPEPTEREQAEVGALVERILAAKKSDPAADTSAWEREIDGRVYKLYGLTAEEIKIVEGVTQGKGCGKE